VVCLSGCWSDAKHHVFALLTLTPSKAKRRDSKTHLFTPLFLTAIPSKVKEREPYAKTRDEPERTGAVYEAICVDECWRPKPQLFAVDAYFS